jgi:hypothetical protein
MPQHRTLRTSSLSVTAEDFTLQRYHESDLPKEISPRFELETSGKPHNLSRWHSQPNEGDLSSIGGLFVDKIDTIYESPRTIQNYEEWEDLSYGSSTLQLPSILPDGDWIAGDVAEPLLGHLDIRADPNWAGDWFRHAEMESGAFIKFGKEPSVFSCESTCSTCPTEPTGSTSTPVSIPIPAVNSRTPYPLSGRGSRNESWLQYSSSEPRKYRIKPMKQSKQPIHDTNELSQCGTCDRQFTLKKDLERHRLSKHTDRPRWFCPVQGCPFATKGFKRKDKAFQHIRTHRRSSDVGLQPMFNTDDESSSDLYFSDNLHTMGTSTSSQLVASHSSHIELGKHNESRSSNYNSVAGNRSSSEMSQLVKKDMPDSEL